MTSHAYDDSDVIAREDADLVTRVLSGERQQFAYLVQRYQTALYRYAVSMVLDHDAAADMVQDAFVRAYMNLAACRNPQHFRAWLFQTLRNRCLDYLKEARRRDVPLDCAQAVEDGAELPDVRTDRVRLRRELRTAVAALPDAHREAFLLHYVQGLSYEEMSGLLGASVSALKMRALRARNVLAAALQERNVTKTRWTRLVSRPLAALASPVSEEER